MRDAKESVRKRVLCIKFVWHINATLHKNLNHLQEQSCRDDSLDLARPCQDTGRSEPGQTVRLISCTFFLDCLYLDGSSYTGNMSVTLSGIPCQSWSQQCPHRHTMNNTYPELNRAHNFCRNPQSSGTRPWCFTTDRDKRWEYCDVPKCMPGMWS